MKFHFVYFWKELQLTCIFHCNLGKLVCIMDIHCLCFLCSRKLWCICIILVKISLQRTSISKISRSYCILLMQVSRFKYNRINLFNFAIIFIYNVLSNMFRPGIRTSSGWCFWYKNTIVVKCVTLMREERRLRMFEKRVLRRIFGPRMDKVTGE